MNLLSTTLRGLPEYRSLLRSVETSDAAAVTGLSSIHRAHLIAALRSDTGRPILTVCQDDLAAARMAEELSGFLGEKPPVFPARELTLLGAASVSRGWEHARLGILHQLSNQGYPVLVTSVEAMSLYTMPRSVLVASAIPLAVGGSYDMDELIRRLGDLGYRRSTLVEGAGQFARRGGILDVYSPGAPGPVRAEFFGDELDSMGFFDTTSQRRTENTEEILLLPTAEVLPRLHPGGIEGLTRDLDSMIARQKRRKHPNEALMETLNTDRELLSSGASFSAADRYIRLIYPEPETLADYLSPETIVVFSDRIAIERQQKQQQEELGQALDSLLANGTLAGELCEFYEYLEDSCGKLSGNSVLSCKIALD